MARMFNMALAPWGVLGGGRFQSKKALAERAAKGEALRSFGQPPVQSEKEALVSDALCKVAEEHGIESPTTIALAYVMSKAANVFPIIGGRKVEHLQENIAGLSIKLTEEQIKFLEGVVPFEKGFPHDFTGDDPNVTGFSRRIGSTGTVVFPHAHI